MLDKISILKAVSEAEKLDVAYDQRDLLSLISDSLIGLHNNSKPYNYRRIYEHSVTEEHKYQRYAFDYTIYQLVVMPVPARIEILLDSDSTPYEIEEGESLNITTISNLMAISNTANPAITEEARIYCFGRK